MRQACPQCGGPVVRCSVCGRNHCDDISCSDMPIACAFELTADAPS